MPDAINTQRTLAKPRYVLPGFTLIELLIVIAILGILAAIVLTALNPSAQLAAVQNAKRKANIYTQGTAITQHVIGFGRPPADDIPVGALLSKAICRPGITDASCVNMDALVPTFIADLPTDPAETNDFFTGYEVYQDDASRYFVCSDYLPDVPDQTDDGRCGNSTYTGPEEEEGGDGGDGGDDGGDDGGGDGGDDGGEGGGGGVSCGGTTPITTCTDLQNMSVDGSYYLANDIDCSATSGWNSGAGFQPIGNVSAKFTGALDGNGHLVNNIVINRPSESYVGIFAYLTTGCISDIHLRNINYTTAGDTGGIVGDYNGEYAGVGNIIDSSVTGTISTYGANGRVGGLVGDVWNGGVIRRSWTDVDITTVVTSYTNNGYAGGLAGSVSSLAAVYDSYALGNVTATNTKAGGFTGGIYSTPTATVVNSYAAGNVQSDIEAGGFTTNSGDQPTFTNNYYDSQTTGQSDTTYGVNPRTTAQMRQQATFSNWDFENIWEIDEGEGYPTLR